MAHEIEYWPNGNKKWEAWKNEKGEFHRKDGPAEILYYRNGNKKYERYYINGKSHRENGPVDIWWFQNGNKDYEAYYINGKPNRKDGPAFVWYYKNGKIKKRLWLFFGDLIDIKKYPVVLDGKFFNFVPTDEQILDVIKNFNRKYGMFLKKFKEENYEKKNAQIWLKNIFKAMRKSLTLH